MSNYAVPHKRGNNYSEGFNSSMLIISNTPLELEEKSCLKEESNKNDIKQKSKMRDKYLKYLNIPDDIKFTVAFRFAENVDYSDLEKAFSPRHRAGFLSLFSALRVFENYLTHKNIKTERGKFITISRDFLRETITTFGPRASKLIDSAAKLGYIEKNNSYQVGEFSKAYRLGRKFENAKWVKMDFLDCLERNIVGEKWSSDSRLPQTTLWNKFNMHRSESRETKDPILKSIADKQLVLYKDLTVVDDGTLKQTISISAEEKFAETKYQDSLLRTSKLPEDYSVDSIIKCYLNSYEIINQGDVYIVFHDKSYLNWTERMFHPVTNLPSALRKYLRYKGQKLINIDIRAAQVCLLAIFYDVNNELDRTEKEKFISSVTEKDFYVEVSKNTNLTRSQAKEATFKLMFAQNYNQNGAIYEEFKRLFPRLIEIIYNVKKNEGYKRVSQVMQRTESRIMIRGALYNILVDSDKTVFSIHDSLLCLKENVNQVKNAISNAFFEEMKFYPVLKID